VGSVSQLRSRNVLNTDPPSDNRATVTARERWVLALLATYRTYEEIADTLGLSRNTIKSHIRHIYKKLRATTRSEAVELAVEIGLITEPVVVPIPCDGPPLTAWTLHTLADASEARWRHPGYEIQSELTGRSRQGPLSRERRRS
jgi:DNA-binding CsgD family transcriptional regulator